MTKPAFIVEGHLEQAFVQAICEGSPVRRIGCNGTDVKIEAVAKHVATHARLLQRKYDPLIVVFDREGRLQTCIEIEVALKAELIKQSVTARIIVGIPDRDIESWILADYEMFANTVGINPSINVGPFDGVKCKGKIKALSSGKCCYNEVLHGVDWLKAARPYKMQVSSSSFARFRGHLQGLGCRWLQQEAPLIE